MREKILRVIKNPIRYLLVFLNNIGLHILDDENYIRLLYYLKFNRKINLKNPQEFNEKLNWLKLYDRKEIYQKMVDKNEVKNYVSNIIGNEYVIPTYAVYNSFDEIELNELPNQFVMKVNHYGGSKGVYIVKDKITFDFKKCKKSINKIMKKNLYYLYREWPYKNIKPKIIIEKYLEDYENKGLMDYKVYAFNNKCDYVMLCLDRESKTKFIYFDKNWNMIKEFSNDGIKYGDKLNIEKPKNLSKMFEFACRLSKNIPFVRVDFYETNGNLYFGELTFFPSGGFDNTRTLECQKYLDNKLKIKE